MTDPHDMLGRVHAFVELALADLKRGNVLGATVRLRQADAELNQRNRGTRPEEWFTRTDSNERTQDARTQSQSR